MLSLQITDIKKMTELLFTRDAFDKFMLREAEIATAVTASIDGVRNRDFYAEDEQAESMKLPCILWSEIRPVCMKLISGKRLPIAFKLILLTQPDTTAALIRNSGFSGCEVTSLSVNISWHDSMLFLTTGIAYSGFAMDKSLEKYWDENVLKFLNSKECSYETL